MEKSSLEGCKKTKQTDGRIVRLIQLNRSRQRNAFYIGSIVRRSAGDSKSVGLSILSR